VKNLAAQILGRERRGHTSALDGRKHKVVGGEIVPAYWPASSLVGPFAWVGQSNLRRRARAAQRDGSDAQD
jgi:hypothetical protein